MSKTWQVLTHFKNTDMIEERINSLRDFQKGSALSFSE